MGLLETLRLRILPQWKMLVVILLPILALPLPIIGKTQEAKAAYTIIIIAVYWMTEALPLGISSLMPVALFPLMGVLSTGQVCHDYMNESNMMAMGGMIMALSVERSNLHKRIALRVMILVGANPRWLLLGIMVTTMFLSMWISNTSTTVLMVPIVEALIKELDKDDVVDDANDPQMEFIPSSKTSQLKKRNIRNCLFLSVAYSSNIGGTGTQTGSVPQLYLKGILSDVYGSELGLNFATWMIFNVPVVIVNIFLSWLWLQLLFIGFKRGSRDENREKRVDQFIRREYNDLGPMRFQEIATLVLFITCISLWFFRNPPFGGGWGQLFPHAKVGDATTAMAVVVLLCIVPAQPKFWSAPATRPTESTGPESENREGALLNWKYIQEKIPWDLFLIMGAGFAISDASKTSGLSLWLGNGLKSLKTLPPFALLLVTGIMTTSLTEIASNSATANILLPILAEMGRATEVNPLFLLVPAAATCSYGFMLPVSTPSNAIVFTAAKMNPIEMMKAGFVMNIICVFIVSLSMVTYGGLIFDIYTPPHSVMKNTTVAVAACLTNCTGQ